MNRIQLAIASTGHASPPLTRVKQKEFETSFDASLCYTLFVPLHYESNYSYPLIVWLHGPHDDERQLQRVMPLVSMRNYAAVGPRGTARSEGNLPGFHWRQTEKDIEQAQQEVSQCIELACQRMNIARRRIFIGGYACGGTMAFRIALNWPERFAGVMSVGGMFPTGLTPLVNIDRARQLPLFIAQGRQAKNYPVERTCDELRLFHAAGLSVSLRQYPGGDELTTQILRDMDAWIMEQVTGEKSFTNEQTTWLDEMN